MSDEPREIWDVRRLEERIAQRSGDDAAPGVEEVLIAFARWKSWEDTYGIAAAQEKERLDRLLDRLPPERWEHTKELVGQVDDALLLELMHYSTKRALEESKQMVRELETLRDDPDKEATDSHSEPDDDAGNEPHM
jgi:muconolactone delta-isomerase